MKHHPILKQTFFVLHTCLKTLGLKSGAIFTIVYLSLAPSAFAHLVSYEGGAEVMVESMGSMRSQLSAIYSPKWWLGTGVVYDRISPQVGQKLDVYTVQAAVLLRRWNSPNAQGNFYLHLGTGHMKAQQVGFEDTQDMVMKYGLRLDYETRRVYTAVEYFSILGLQDENQNKNLADSLMLSVGIAPYIAQYEDLNTWFIAKVMWRNDFKNIEIFPAARFFFKNVLWEVGQSLNGETLFAFMMRY